MLNSLKNWKVTLAAFALLVGGFTGIPSTEAGLNQPAGDSAAVKPHKPVVFIYYANEMAPDAAEAARVANYTKWLRETGNSDVISSAEGIEGDLTKFPSQVDRETAAIRAGHGDATSNRPAVVIFTNRLAREGKCETAPSNEPGDFQTVDFQLSANRRGLYHAYPLSAKEVFQAAMNRVAELYSPSEYEFVLVAKSHGSANLAIGPKYQYIAESDQRESFDDQMLKLFASRGIVVKKGDLSLEENTTMSLEENTTMSVEENSTMSLEENTTMSIDDDAVSTATNRSNVGSYGVTKVSLVATLTSMSQTKEMRFPVLLLESCKSQLSSEQREQLTGNNAKVVGQLWTSDDKGLPYETCDYVRIFASLSENKTFAEALSDLLTEQSAAGK
jgi:hypothetical protein